MVVCEIMGWYWNRAENRWRYKAPKGQKTENKRRGPKIYTQANACPYCGVLNWARFTAEQFYLMPDECKKVKHHCKNCKKVYLAWIFGDNFD